MEKPLYFKPTLVRRHSGTILDHDGVSVNERERGLLEDCEEGGKHHFLILPFEEGQKEYLKCLKCFQITHF